MADIDERLSKLEDEAYIAFHEANLETDVKKREALEKEYQRLMAKIDKLERQAILS